MKKRLKHELIFIGLIGLISSIGFLLGGYGYTPSLSGYFSVLFPPIIIAIVLVIIYEILLWQFRLLSKIKESKRYGLKKFYYPSKKKIIVTLFLIIIPLIYLSFLRTGNLEFAIIGVTDRASIIFSLIGWILIWFYLPVSIVFLLLNTPTLFSLPGLIVFIILILYSYIISSLIPYD